jgi:hypothetical protein
MPLVCSDDYGRDETGWGQLRIEPTIYHTRGQLRIDPTIYHTRGQHVNYYTTVLLYT